jgi:chromosome segregation and condensation protein ScpB
MMRGLVEKNSKKINNVNIDVYKTSLDFLKKLGISSIKELPEYNELSRYSEKNNIDG